VTTRLAAGNVIVGFSGHVIMPVTSIASQTWKLRMGAASGTFYWLQNSAGGLFSTADCLIWEAEEIAYES